MPRRVLVVDDDPLQQELLTKALANEGYTVETAGDGLDALTAIERRRPDLILCDAIMPRLDGMTFLRAVKGHVETRRIPVIMITAMAEPSAMIEATNLGARYFISKPFTIDEVIRKVKRAMRSSIVEEV